MSKPPPDADVRVRALDVRQSFIVQAPAGSGKTTLLVDRFIALLLIAQQPTEVVAITFTRKAAAEMRHRALKALRDSDPTSPGYRAWARHREFGVDLRAQPELLRVLTFDKLFVSLVNQSPLALGLGADLRLQDDARESYAQAAREALADPDVAKSAAALVTQLDSDLASATQLIASLLSRRDQWLSLSYDEVATQPQRIRRAFAGAVAEQLNELRTSLEQTLDASLIDDLLYSARVAFAYRSFPYTVGRTLPLPETLELDVWQALVSLLVTAEGDLRKPEGIKVNTVGLLKTETKAKHSLASVLRAISGIDHIKIRLLTVRDLPFINDDEDVWTQLTDTWIVLQRAAAILAMNFAAAGEADFVATAVAAASGLNDNETTLPINVAASIRHLLVDEFQDTSRTQFRFLEGVTRAWNQFGSGAETLFCVGDPMQSIYRFRQADVSLFAVAQQHGIGGKALEPLTLTSNFRSTEALVSWVNRQLGVAFASPHPLSRSRVPFAPAQSASEEVAIEPCVTLSAHEDFDAELSALVEQVRVWLGQYRDVGVLAQTGKHGRAAAAVLLAAGIDIDASALDAHTQPAWMRDALSLAYALSEPEDSLSVLASLRAPWCGVSLKDVTVVAATFDSIQKPFVTRLREATTSPRLSAQGRERLTLIATVLDAVDRASGWRTLATRLDAAWTQLDASACYADFDGARYAALLSLMVEREEGGLILDRESLTRALEKTRSAVPTSAARVQVLTIHKAKGLEFDAVAVIGLNSARRHDETPLVRWAQLADEYVAVPKPRSDSHPGASLFKWLKTIDDVEADAERRRLLYVAVTRAKLALHLSATVKIDKKSSEVKEAPKGTLWSLLSSADLPAPQSEKLPGSSASRDASMLVRRVRMPIEQVPPLPILKPYRTAADDTNARAFGIVVHRWLALHGHRGRWNDSVRTWARSALVQEGAHEATVDALLDDFRAVVARLPDCAHAQRIFAGGLIAYDELNLCCTDARDGFTMLRPDRVIIEPTGNAWIVDYKTSRPSDGIERATFLASERARYTSTMQAYVRAVKASGLTSQGRDVRAALYFPVIGEWIEV